MRNIPITQTDELWLETLSGESMARSRHSELLEQIRARLRD